MSKHEDGKAPTMDELAAALSENLTGFYDGFAVDSVVQKRGPGLTLVAHGETFSDDDDEMEPFSFEVTVKL